MTREEQIRSLMQENIVLAVGCTEPVPAKNVANAAPKSAKNNPEFAKISDILNILLDFIVLCIYFKGIEGFASALIEFTEKFYKLKSVSVDICS